MAKTIDDLRKTLFETIEGVRTGNIDIDKGRLIGDLAQVMVNSAKAEVEYLKTTGSSSSIFLESRETGDEKPDADNSQTPRVITHRLRG